MAPESPPRFAFIIPVAHVNGYVTEVLTQLLRLDRPDWEAWVITNTQEPLPVVDERIHLLASGRVGPADKRDLAATRTRSPWLVFLDDDSYPAPDHLSRLDSAIASGAAAYGGPAVTPPTAGLIERASGAMYSTAWLGGSPARYRPTGKPRPVADWPSVNLAVHAEAFADVGGFDCGFWPGDDTFFCDKVTRRGLRIEYRPELVAYHHRRTTVGAHLRQAGGYGLHRGYFARHFGASSRRLPYFLPSALVLGLVAVGILALVGVLPWWGVLVVVGPYLIALVLGGVSLLRAGHSLTVAATAVPLAAATHIWYGVRFLQGLALRGPLVSRLR